MYPSMRYLLILSSYLYLPSIVDATIGTWRHHSKTNNHTCQSCVEARDELAKLRLERIKREILDKIGLEAPPQVHVNDGFYPSIPQVTKYVDNRLRREHGLSPQSSPYLPFTNQESLNDWKTERTFIFAEPPPAIYTQSLPVACFKFSSDIMSKSLRLAALNVFLRKPTRLLPADSRIVTLQLVVKEVLTNGKFGSPLAERKQHVDLTEGGYVHVLINADDIKRWWTGENGKNDFLGLYVEAYYKGENLAIHPQHNSDNQMNLELTTVDEYSRRKRSYPEMCTKEMNEPSCCLYSLVVDFEEAGWDFVIAPKLYDAHMCSGECKLHHAGRSTHSKITSSTTKNAVGGCCHPTEYDSITLVYMTQEKELKIREVPGMIARHCTCA